MPLSRIKFISNQHLGQSQENSVKWLSSWGIQWQAAN